MFSCNDTIPFPTEPPFGCVVCGLVHSHLCHRLYILAIVLIIVPLIVTCDVFRASDPSDGCLPGLTARGQHNLIKQYKKPDSVNSLYLFEEPNKALGALFV